MVHLIYFKCISKWAWTYNSGLYNFSASEPPLALDVFENSVFVLVSGSDGSIVLELDKFLGRNHSKMYLPDHTHDIVVAHPLKQKKGKDTFCVYS